MGGGSGRLRDRPPAPVPRGDVRAARRRAGARAPRGDRPACAGPVAIALPRQDWGRGEHRACVHGVRAVPRRAGWPLIRPSRMEEPMLPPRPLRRVVLAPLVIVLAIAVIVLSPLIALLALTFGLVRRSRSGRAGRLRGVRLLVFALVWLAAETATLFMCLGLWLASGFGGRMHTEPFQSRHYAIMRWFLDAIYRTATGTFGVRVEVDEPELTADEQAARLARPVIVLSRHAGPGDSLLLVHHLLSV